jgi:hypothetical protein
LEVEKVTNRLAIVSVCANPQSAKLKRWVDYIEKLVVYLTFLQRSVCSLTQTLGGMSPFCTGALVA